jgi:hypothetical protein
MINVIEAMKDNVKEPSHYKGEIECIAAIKASMSQQQFKGFLKGNVMKYLWRYDRKNGLEDLQKADVYLQWLIKEEAIL